VRWQYARLAESLSSASPEEILKVGDRKLLKVFHQAARMVPAYRKLLQDRGVDPRSINTLEDFRSRVPIVDKRIIFTSHNLRDICIGGNLDGISHFCTSSGYTGEFAYGIEPRGAAEKQAVQLEFLLDNAFGITRRRTLLINCNPMGVKVPTRTIALAETGVRSDVVVALVKKLSSEFDQFILNGESAFLKKVVEEGKEAGVPWRDLVVHVVTGAEFVAENWRSYLAHLLGIDLSDPSRGSIGVNMGISELSLSIFCENAQTIQLRRLAYANEEFRCALGVKSAATCPLIMQYYPQNTYLETVPDEEGRPQLVVTTLDMKRRIPLIRYNTKDVVMLLTYDQFRNLICPYGYGALLPRFHLPVGLIWGRAQVVSLPNGGMVSPNDVKEAIYQDFHIAEMLTGNFRIEKRDGDAVLAVQHKHDSFPSRDIGEQIARNLLKHVGRRVEVEVVPYHKFLYGMELSYEKKNQYI
jgi:phenylacetate-CoA ligase